MFGFPKADYSIKDTFKRNFLKTIVFQIKFEETKVLFKNKTSIHTKFQDLYPRLHDSQRNYEIKINKNETPIVNSTKGDAFMLRTLDGLKTLTFSPASIDLNITGSCYEDFGTILDVELKKIIEVVNEYEIKNISRVAIRKINIIGLGISKDSNIALITRDLLNSQIGYSFSSFPLEEEIDQNMSSVHYKKDLNTLNLKIGYSVQKLVTPNIGHIICDIDRYNESNIPAIEVLDEFSKINSEIFDVFIWALSEKSLNILQNG